MSRLSVRLSVLAALLGASFVAVQPVPAAAITCSPSNSHVWFLGVVYDAQQREDFLLDIDNFEHYLSTLRTVYCIPDSQAKILAMENNLVRNGKTYEAATEAAVKSQLASMGSAASAFPDSIFYFFLSSHGIVATGMCGNILAANSHLPSSLSNLKGGLGQDGNFYDCELGAALNNNFQPHVRMFIGVDCSLCGGFSDSLTPVSGTVPDNALPKSSGVPKPNRIVVTGCAITTECFGGDQGGVSYGHLRRTIDLGLDYCDGWTAPGFPAFQGLDAPVKSDLLNAPDGRCTASEWFFGAVQSAYELQDLIAIQQQFRIKYGFATLAEDLQIF